MDRPYESGPEGTIAAARRGEVDVDAHTREQVVAIPSVSAVAGPASSDAMATNGAGRRGGGIDSGRHGGSSLAGRFMPSSRRRVARRALAAGDAERERIEQALHDGAQAHLTALRIQLSLAAQSFRERGETEAGAVLDGFGEDVEHVIDEVRDLAHGLYPALLARHGLTAALVSAGMHAGGPVIVHANGVRRCRREVELAVYFSCLAAVDNAAQHAGPTPVSVYLSDTGGALHFAVYDSGAGFDPRRTPAGTGIVNMRARIAAVGGTLTVDSAPADGTRVQASVPDPGWI
ncbi:MAG TPA: histidine kinase [Solirubrobacteraceae bacterium]|nr:histidine kinase [Solirubrobacteraceae bacterium]